MKIGTTTFGFRYLFLEPARAPAWPAVIDTVRAHGLDALQVCENARPLEISSQAWDAALAHASDAGIEIQLGCKTTNLEVFRAYLDRAAELPSRLLRLVFEEESGTAPDRNAVERFLEKASPLLEKQGVRLAIENHFDVPSEVLAAVVAPYPESLIGFCIDTANSLRNFESPRQVLQLLGARALCYHLKDFEVAGDKLGFRVSGAPLGSGKLELDAALDHVLARKPAAGVFIENWVPSTGVWEDDVREDERWLRLSAESLRAALERRNKS